MRTDKYVYGFGDRLKEAIKDAGMTDAEIERQLHFVGRGAIYKYTSLNQMPCCMVLARLSLILGVSTDWLLGLAHDKQCTVLEVEA